MDVMIICEDPVVTKEIIGKGRELADVSGGKVIAFAPTPATTVAADEMIWAGADHVYKLSDAPDDFDVERFTTAGVELIGKENPRVVLVGSTKTAKELGPRIAARLDRPVAMDVIDLRIVDDKLEADRVVYGGNGIETLTFDGTPAIATIAPRTFKEPETDGSRTGPIEELDVDLGTSRVTLLGIEKKAGGNVQLEDATVIASCGRGIKDRADIEIVQQLATVLDGELGCSRPIASDLEWLSVDHWVGLSGKRVKPSLYIACGISGQIQHLAGMRDSKTIVAINKDENAPILKAADYYIIGDIYKIVPELTEKLRK